MPESLSSRATIALIQRYYDHFNRGDMAAFLSLLSEQVVHDLNQGARETGREAFSAFMQCMNRCYREQIVELHIFASDDGQRAAAEFTVLGEYLATDAGLPEAHGQKYRLAAGAFFELQNGQITRISNSYNLQDWLRQISP